MSGSPFKDETTLKAELPAHVEKLASVPKLREASFRTPAMEESIRSIAEKAGISYEASLTFFISTIEANARSDIEFVQEQLARREWEGQ